jgi:N-acetylglucosaminyldiphosphoundecaprenol N-acetyl-beta-D-mannosaminyltransferase
MVPQLAERAAQKGHSIFLLGAGPGVAERAATLLCERYPELKIAGVLAPPFSPVLEMDPQLVETVKAAHPDILLVAFGNPKQEKWIAMHRHELGVPVMIGVGGSLDFLTGTTQRAPLWMQRMGLEWLHRMLQDPRRLWRRYVDDFFVFGAFMLRQWWAMRSLGQPAAALPLQEAVRIGTYAILPVQGRLAVQNLPEFSDQVQQLLAETPHIIVDLSRAEFLDSSAIGSLVHFAKEARVSGGELILAAVPEAVNRVLELLRLDSYFVTAPNAMAVIRQPTDEINHPDRVKSDGHASGTRKRGGETWTVITIPRRLDGGTAESVHQSALNTLQKTPQLLLDFSGTVFLASAGLAVLADLHRRVDQANGEMILTGCNRDVSKVIQLIKFDQFLNIEP